MATEAGQQYNPETARDLRPRSFVFDGYGVRFAYVLEIPEYICKRMDSALKDQLEGYMTGYAQRCVLDAMKGGYLKTESGLGQMRADVGAHLRNYIWERFSITQEREGNDTWEVAPSLQQEARL